MTGESRLKSETCKTVVGFFGVIEKNGIVTRAIGIGDPATASPCLNHFYVRFFRSGGHTAEKPWVHG